MNNYQQLFDLIIEGFSQNGFEIVNRNSWICTMRRWKLSHEFVDLKVIESEVNIFFDSMDEPTQIVTRFAYYEKE